MNKWKIHLYWTIAFATFLLIAIITFWLGGKGSEIVSYISFASALISIVLALVAIFYSVVQNVSSQQNIGEMRTLVSEASRIITEKAGTITDKAELMEQTLKMFVQPSAKDTDVSSPIKHETFHFNTSGISYVSLLILYYFAKCYEFQKPVELGSMYKLAVPDTEEELRDSRGPFYFSFLTLGITQGLSCFLELDSIDFKTPPIDKVEIKKLPSGFKENVLCTINNLIKDPDVGPSYKKLLETSVQKIDAYVTAA